ncbi:hypothetical protein FM114_05965 [Luteococcus japonicus LSP_Lj1]|uniref:Uncharacterized protein n=1 Tax=Luteococcus japonicus LSP_Lj1 TaxID=1255658 RepID=A0A1R4J7Q8_9ACTN|nr:hypothetical protein FM114_05965 [Luteococcus japonicus LSP_Lj1]
MGVVLRQAVRARTGRRFSNVEILPHKTGGTLIWEGGVRRSMPLTGSGDHIAAPRRGSA